MGLYQGVRNVNFSDFTDALNDSKEEQKLSFQKAYFGVDKECYEKVFLTSAFSFSQVSC